MDRHILSTIDPMVLGDRLAMARRSRRLTQQQVADVLGVARTTLVAIEKGERRPRAAELMTLADLLGRRASDFLRPDDGLGQVDFVTQFRANRNGGTVADAVRDQDIQWFERLCRWYRELEGLSGGSLARRYPTPYDISGIPPERAALDVATAERNRLGLGDGPLGDLWNLLEADVGLRVFTIPMRDHRIAGMYIFAETFGGCIAVNSNQPEDHRRWSAMAEYGYFLTARHRTNVTLLSGSKRSKAHERFAAAFAHHFLVPAAGLARRFDALGRAKRAPFNTSDLLQLASRYGVPAEMMAQRLEVLRLLPAGTWERLAELESQPIESKHLHELGGRGTDAPRLPTHYQALAVQAYLAGNLTEGQLAERLGTDRVGAREIVEQARTISQPVEDGSWIRLTLDLGQPLAAS